MTPQEKRQQMYREKYKEIKPTWDDSIVILSRLFKEYAKVPGMVVLDAGCGRNNEVLEQKRSLIRHIVGIDATKEAVQGNTIANEIVIGDVELLPFEAESFDAVVSLWVLEHIQHPDRLFSEVSRVLKPGGVFFFVTPYAYSYPLILKRVMGMRVTQMILDRLYGRTEDDTFQTYYKANTEKDLRKLGADAEFKERVLIANEDPSYLAFNRGFFCIALIIQRVARFLHLHVATMHLVGVYEKQA